MLRGSLPLLILRAPLIDQLGHHIVEDGVEAKETIKQSNNQLGGMVDTETDDWSITLLF